MLTSEKRSALMRRIGGKNTKPEMRLRKALHAEGVRYRLHDPRLPGRPDIVLPGRRLVIFVHGCFWHRHMGCRRTTTPKTNVDYWMKKFSDNIERDKRKVSELECAGWHVKVIWECEILDDAMLERIVNEISEAPTRT